MKIAVLTDSGSGLTKEEADQSGLFLLPLQVTIDENNYKDGYGINSSQVAEFIQNGEFPKTSGPSVNDIDDIFNQMLEKGYDTVISIPLSSGLSSTHLTIEMVAREKNIPIYTIETYTTCLLQKYITFSALKLIKKGLSIEEIIDTLNNAISKSYSLIIPSDMEHLKRGGRLTPLAASMANLLKILPILKLGPDTNGKIDVLKKVRTEKKAIQVCSEYLCEFMKEEKENYKIFLMYSNDNDKANVLAEHLNTDEFDYTIEIEPFSSVILSHVGLHCLGMSIIKEIN